MYTQFFMNFLVFHFQTSWIACCLSFLVLLWELYCFSFHITSSSLMDTIPHHSHIFLQIKKAQNTMFPEVFEKQQHLLKQRRLVESIRLKLDLIRFSSRSFFHKFNIKMFNGNKCPHASSTKHSKEDNRRPKLPAQETHPPSTREFMPVQDKAAPALLQWLRTCSEGRSSCRRGWDPVWDAVKHSQHHDLLGASLAPV